MGAHTNRLAGETSPYLLQHADNPVEWYPWGEEALERACREDKPILLSIGYSACHWCHVMAHESFEDPATAQVMNELFINIKVDREERPDLDKIYQTAHQLLTQHSGGWPLNVFLTPDDHTPFFSGTYFPPARRYNMAPFVDVLRQVAHAYHRQREDIQSQNATFHTLLERVTRLTPATQDVDAVPLALARRELEQHYDARHGGFGGAPKFPNVTSPEFLLHQWDAQGRRDEHGLNMVVHTLRAMARGGICDQLGGGFFRYSVDERWLIPHFEKMLYDNALLLALYTQAWQATGDAELRAAAERTGDWVLREMQSPEGGYYSTLDADSEGEEGRYYVWQRDEVRSLLSDEEYRLFAQIYGLDWAANFEDRWHLFQAAPPAVGSEALLRSACARLLAHRAQRMLPGRDEKILTGWNGLMIRALALAGRVLGRPDFIASAERALDFVRGHLLQGDRLLASCKDGRARFTAYLDDYAFLLDAQLELMQTRWRDGELDLAVTLAEAMLAHFSDSEQGGFYFTADDHEALLHRPRPLADEALPSGNGIAARALLRLGHLLGEPRYLEAAHGTLRAAWHAIGTAPSLHCSLLLALDEWLHPPLLVILRGPAAHLPPWQTACDAIYAARRLVLPLPNGARDLRGALQGFPESARPIAYVCADGACGAPVMDLGELAAAVIR